MSTQRIDQMLDMQNQPSPGLDPFAQAQSVFAQKQVPQSFMDNSLEQQMQFPQANQPAQPQQPVSNGPKTGLGLFSPGGPKALAQFSSTKLPQALQGMGIDSKGLALNSLGRVQLLGRLQNKFGADYLSNPNAMQVLSLFDDSLRNNSQSITPMVANGERTLNALYGVGK